MKLFEKVAKLEITDVVAKGTCEDCGKKSATATAMRVVAILAEPAQAKVLGARLVDVAAQSNRSAKDAYEKFQNSRKSQSKVKEEVQLRTKKLKKLQ